MDAYEDVQERLQAAPEHWLVTGAAGFIGSHLVEALLGLGQRVTGLDNFAAGKRSNLEAARARVGEREWRRFTFIGDDIRSRATCHAVCRGVNVVLHQAALASVPQSIHDPLASHEVNVGGFLNVLAAAHGEGVRRVVYASSSAVYGADSGLPQVEARTAAPLSPYAASKQADELYAGVFARCHGVEAIGLRYFNVFGERQDTKGAYAAVIPTWIAAMVAGTPVHINGDGSTTRDFCDVADVVQANLLAACAPDPAAVNQAYNVGSGEPTRLDALCEILRSSLLPRCPHLRELRPIYRPDRAGDIRASLADIGKARRLLGYEPRWSVRSGLARALDWYLETLVPRPAAIALRRELEETA